MAPRVGDLKLCFRVVQSHSNGPLVLYTCRPIAVTLLSSYYSIRLPANEKTPPISKPVIAVDILTSFVVIPFFVVWFWRGSWLVMDFYLWKFSPEKADVWTSIGWSALMAIGFMLVASETVFAFITTENTLVLALLGRLRTYVLAWGVVNYWRAVWYIWDELCGTSQWSCWICHLAPLGVLMSMGCMSCILAPASTIGVDVVPHPGTYSKHNLKQSRCVPARCLLSYCPSNSYAYNVMTSHVRLR